MSYVKTLAITLPILLCGCDPQVGDGSTSSTGRGSSATTATTGSTGNATTGSTGNATTGSTGSATTGDATTGTSGDATSGTGSTTGSSGTTGSTTSGATTGTSGATTGTSGTTTGTTGATTGGTTGTTGGIPSPSPTLPDGTATINVHYPAASHKVTVRGAAAGMSWTTDTATTAAGDVYSVTLTGVTGSVEFKPLLDATTWAIGPNYHATSGYVVDIYPHFTTKTGTVKTLITAFKSSVLNDTRAIYAYLPPSYSENTDATYPVVYMHDGQNLWAALPKLAFSVPWNVDTAFDQASQLGTCSSTSVVGWGAQPLGGTAVTCTGDADCTSSKQCRTFPEAIVIGIANDANRIYEYTPVVDKTETSLGAAGGADQYLKMIVTELKPTIDSMLRTRADLNSTSMCGSSLGGLVTAYAGVKYPNVFSRVAELSPSTWWDSDNIIGTVQSMPTSARPGIVYLDSGSGDADDESDTDMLASAYTTLGYVDGTTVRHVIQPGAQHGETYWSERFPGAMQFILGTR